MIICFSGTGNSRYIADKLQDLLGDETLRLPPGLMLKPQNAQISVPDSRLIWVFPIHSWNLPSIVEKAIKKIEITNPENVEHHLVATCGDDIGYSEKIWRKAIKARGWKAGSAFSVQMPNVYTFLPGFDIDSPDVIKQKLDAVPDRIEKIVDIIDGMDGKKCVDVVKGKYAWAKTYLISPLFKAFLTNTKRFKVDANCNGCGRCLRNCPVVTITMENNRPKWGKDCIMCTRCYHVCPHHAINYGRYTKGKGQFICPGFIVKP